MRVPIAFQMMMMGTSADQYYPSVGSLLHFDGANNSTTFTDQKSNTWTAHGNAKISTAQSEFGGAAGLFDGTNSYISTPDSSALRLGSGDWTIEFWQYYVSKSGFQTIIMKGYSANNGSWVIQTGNGDGKINMYYNTAANLLIGEAGSTVNASQWYFISITRTGSNIYIHRDGTLVQSATGTPNLNDAVSVLAIGGGSSSGFNNFWYNGYMDDFRFTPGAARYSSSSYTRPALVFPNV